MSREGFRGANRNIMVILCASPKVRRPAAWANRGCYHKCSPCMHDDRLLHSGLGLAFLVVSESIIIWRIIRRRKWAVQFQGRCW